MRGYAHLCCRSRAPAWLVPCKQQPFDALLRCSPPVPRPVEQPCRPRVLVWRTDQMLPRKLPRPRCRLHVLGVHILSLLFFSIRSLRPGESDWWLGV
jgi:hypothetical protein